MGKSLLGLVVVVCTTALFGSWAQVHAQTIPVSDVIVFQGGIGITADNTPGCGDGVPDARVVAAGQPETAAVDLIGGCGSFIFVSNVCADYSDGGPVAGAEVGPCSIVSTGNFVNTVCGTGQVNAGSVATIGGVEGASVTYGITFDATVGFVTGSITDTTGDGAGQTEPILLGVVQLGPGGNPLTQDGPVDCTNGFSVPLGLVAVGESPGS